MCVCVCVSVYVRVSTCKNVCMCAPAKVCEVDHPRLMYDLMRQFCQKVPICRCQHAPCTKFKIMECAAFRYRRKAACILFK